MSSRRVEDAPPDPADVEDMRLRIEAHQRASEAEAASARAFRSECERAHGEFLRACARLEEERRARHAKQLEVMEATYARARFTSHRRRIAHCSRIAACSSVNVGAACAMSRGPSRTGFRHCDASVATR